VCAKFRPGGTVRVPDLPVVRLEFAERTISDLDQVETRALPADRRGGIDPVTLDNLASKLEALVRSRRRDAGHDIGETAIDHVGRSQAVGKPCQVAIAGRRKRGEARAEQPEIHDRVFVAAVESSANLAVAARNPVEPRRLDLGPRLTIQLPRQVVWQRV
jgi:hypothetical protein